MTDEQWEQISSLFPVYKTGHPPKDNRLMLNTIPWIARSSAAWHDPSERYSSWKTVYSRFCKWRNDGTLYTLFCALNADADYENLSIDSAIIRVHQHETGAKKGP